MINKCLECGKNMRTKRKDKVFCDSSCYNKWYSKNNSKKIYKDNLTKNPDFNKDKYQKYKKSYNKYYIENRETINKKRAKDLKNNWEKHTLKRIKQKSKRLNIPFNLDIDDIVLPSFCPILGIKLKIGKKNTYNSPSIDRINNQKGYIKGNIQIISFSANAMKSDMSIYMWKKLLKRIKNNV